jgi:hypothetical protein
LGSSGITLRSESSQRLMSSLQAARGGSSMLFSGRNENSSRSISKHSSSSLQAKCAQPERLLCVIAPPSSSLLTSSCVTVLITSGPVMNMYEVSFTMKMKSVMAGEYTAPPAQGP